MESGRACMEHEANDGDENGLIGQNSIGRRVIKRFHKKQTRWPSAVSGIDALDVHEK